MQRVGMIGLQRQRFAIVRFGLRQPAFLMVREAGGKKTGNARIRCQGTGSPGGRLGCALFAVHVLIPPVWLSRSADARLAIHSTSQILGPPR